MFHEPEALILLQVGDVLQVPPSLRSSAAVASYPSSSSLSTTWLPMNPGPPATSALMVPDSQPWLRTTGGLPPYPYRGGHVNW